MPEKAVGEPNKRFRHIERHTARTSGAKREATSHCVVVNSSSMEAAPDR